MTLGLRAAGKKVFGTYPYMEAASLGEGGLGAGESALEEPARQPCAAIAPAASSAMPRPRSTRDLRLRLSHITLILPGAWGLVGFADVGRVWLEGETSDTWHTGVGGGIWLSMMNDRLAFSTGISHSKEADLIYFKGGFHF